MIKVSNINDSYGDRCCNNYNDIHNLNDNNRIDGKNNCYIKS